MQVELIKTLQKERNITNKQIAEKANLSESTVSRILSRQTEPKFEDVVRIAVAMGCSLDALGGIVREESNELKELRSMLAERDALLAEKDAQLATYEKIVTSYDKLLAEKDGGSVYLKRVIRVLGAAVAILTFFLMLADASFILDFVRA